MSVYPASEQYGIDGNNRSKAAEARQATVMLGDPFDNRD